MKHIIPNTQPTHNIIRIYQSNSERQRHMQGIQHSRFNSNNEVFVFCFLCSRATDTQKKTHSHILDIPCSFSLSRCFFFHFVLHCTIYPPYDFFSSLSSVAVVHPLCSKYNRSHSFDEYLYASFFIRFISYT